ncbi:non-ribosomal peptide synthetase module [Paenibacillus sp. 19GGS1-52]|uniref:non-ribosomal peptide synthetase module n=1 Tax=Paenibacillus sp. 19GGS1-52 TaxID=2758563 RepID=UPI001EFBF1A5|nr:non-ribosomal peptide synthetase module [Paenibacillus sp. 19GGS1-52]ULO08629.1 non-ribosomal peptide synthetase module [Paenibacillus sp. 19GGS1-52]
MAQRLATEYVNATLQMTEFQLNQFLLSADTCYISHRVKVLGGGEQEIVLEEAEGEEVHLSFERKGSIYVCALSCQVVNPHLNNAVRKLFITYKGTGTVNRIYKGFTMMYYYEQGSVRRISELTQHGSKTVYQHKHSVAEMMRLYQSEAVEREIEELRRKTNVLLDMRNVIYLEAELIEIDRELQIITQRLFQLEA